MNQKYINLLLADDDLDDCLFFKEALLELPFQTKLVTVNDGEQLMQLLFSESITFPDIIFLDLNMSRKTGFECLNDLKQNDKFKGIPVIIYSTSMDLQVVSMLFEKGAHYYIRKPGDFSKLIKVIHSAITFMEQNTVKPPKENFIIQA